MLTLHNRTCVFAGGTGGIGEGAVRSLSAAGMNVALVTHNPARAQALIDSCSGHPGRVVAYSNEGGDGTAFEKACREFGSVDVAIISTGGLSKVQPLVQITTDHLSRKLEHQVSGAFSYMQAAVPYLTKSKAPRMILIASAGAQDGFPGENIADSIARGAVISMTYVLARELATQGITVNCISRSAMVDDHPPRDDGYHASSVLPLTPRGHLGTTEEFGALVTYIASEESAHTTGHVFNLTGGIHIG